MKSLMKILSLIICLLCLSACSNNSEKIYDVYINNVGYNLEDKLSLEIKLKTNNQNIVVCPIINIEKEGEDDVSKIIEGLNFSTENVEFLNLHLNTFNEIYNDNYWTFETILFNDDEEINLSNGDTIERINFVLKDKGKYNITLKENNNSDACKYTYGDSLSLSISKK